MIDFLKIPNIRNLLILAVLIRLLIMPFYFHPDIKTYHFQASYLRQGVLNIYSYLDKNKDKLPVKEEFVYFPLTYLFLGGYQIIATPFLGHDFFNWLSDASVTSVERIGVYRYLFILKLPYLILDLIIPFILMRFFDNFKQRQEVFIFWLFNPISLFLVYIFSNVDIIPVVLSLISLLLFKQGKFIPSGLLLGISAGFKAYPLLFLPFLLLFQNNIKERILLGVSSILTLVLIIAPFWSNAFVNSTLISGLTTRLAFPGVTIGFNETLMVSVVSLAAFLFWTFVKDNKELNNFWHYILVLLLLLFSTIHYHIQWLLWIVPFMVILTVSKEYLNKLIFLWLFLSFLIPILYDDKSMSVSLLSVISYLYTLLPTVFTLIKKIYDPYALQSIIHSILFALSLILSWEILKIKGR